MRLFALFGAAVLTVALCPPALAWLDSKPGGEYWPPIPGPAGIEAFYGTWLPQCNDGAWHDQVDIIFKPGGTLSYTAKNPYFPKQYRVIETTPFGVTLVVRLPDDKKYGDIFYFWVLRHLSPRNIGLVGINECFPNDFEIKGFRWDFTDEELRKFWDGFTACNPALTYKDPRLRDEGDLYWGEGWGQACHLYRGE